MTQPPVQQYDPERYGDVGMSKMLVASVIAHALALLALPVLLTSLATPKKIERPQTFTLAHAPMPPAAPPQHRVPDRTPTPDPPPRPEPLPTPPQSVPTPAPTPPPEPAPPKPQPPREEPVAPAPKQEQVKKPVEEDLSQLTELFAAMPAPVQVSAAGEVKAHPYLTAVQQKIERNWLPGREDRNLSVLVSFVIHRDGTVTDIAVAASSGDATLDRLARAAVERSSPFTKVPPALTDRLEITCTLRPTRRSR